MGALPLTPEEERELRDELLECANSASRVDTRRRKNEEDDVCEDAADYIKYLTATLDACRAALAQAEAERVKLDILNAELQTTLDASCNEEELRQAWDDRDALAAQVERMREDHEADQRMLCEQVQRIAALTAPQPKEADRG